MKNISIKLLALNLTAVLIFSLVGCSSQKTVSELSTENKGHVTQSNQTEGDEKIMAQREYFKNNPVAEIKTFDVRLRDGKTTRTLKIMSDGMRLTEVSISPVNGKRVGSPVNIIHFSDVHFNAVNDDDKNNPTIMALYEGRDFNKGNKYNTLAAVKSLEFGKLFDRTVITGDLLDHYSFGSMELLKNVILDIFN